MVQRIAACLLTSLLAGPVAAQTFQAEVGPLVASSCIHCHDAATQTRLDFERLGHDLSDPDTFRQWQRIYDRVHDGEMPPESEDRPDAAQMAKALGALKQDLREANFADQRRRGRVPSRRLTRLEYGYTIRDLLQIEQDLAKALPAESDSGGFDTVGSTQGMSSLHIRSYLQAADLAIDAAIQLGQRPASSNRIVDYLNSPFVNRWYDLPLIEGGDVIRKLDDAVALFVDLDYVMRSDFCGLQIPSPGYYRLAMEAYAYEAKTPVTLKLILASEQRGGAELLGAYDLLPDQRRTVELTAYLQPGDYLYPSVADLDGPNLYVVGGARNYKGEGVAVKPLHVDGPLVEEWPPASTRQLLVGVPLVDGAQKSSLLDSLSDALKSLDPRGRSAGFEVSLTREPMEHVTEIVTRFAPLAFRRPATDEEVESFASLAGAAIAENREFTEVVRVPLRAILSAPQFLFFGGEPGELDDFALASRLSYFLWKSMPDEELFQAARDGRLSDPAVLAGQVDRMLDDERSQRFVRDFLGQWLKLYDINATTPDEHLYPEFDDVLNQSIVQETERFFTELIAEDLSARNLIDSDYTFLNRRLAEHYGIAGVTGQQFRRVALPAESLRGGVLTQASVLKVTANGTVTSPVTRGNFVLTNLLGTPPSAPPPDVGSIEPDTRGTTTIREVLAAHRDVESCAKCHREIDPPGFALECFDPIGGFRTRYRATSGEKIAFQSLLRLKLYKQGPEVDASGVTADGKAFSGIRQFKQLLLEKEEQVARHFISQLIVYATGGEIQFADREHLAGIVERTRAAGFPVRTIIHEVVQSELFRNK